MARNLIALFIILSSCQETTTSEKNSVLTRTTWEPEQWILFNGKMSNYHYPVKFLPDGNYTLGEPGKTLNGTWKWISDNQIQLTIHSMDTEDGVIEFPSVSTFHLLIKKLTKNEFRYIIDGKDTFFKEDEEVNLIAMHQDSER